MLGTLFFNDDFDFLLETTLQLGFSEVWMCFQSLESLKNKITNIKKYPLVSGRFSDMWKSIKCGTSAIRFCATSCLSYSHIAIDLSSFCVTAMKHPDENNQNGKGFINLN